MLVRRDDSVWQVNVCGPREPNTHNPTVERGLVLGKGCSSYHTGRQHSHQSDRSGRRVYTHTHTQNTYHKLTYTIYQKHPPTHTHTHRSDKQQGQQTLSYKHSPRAGSLGLQTPNLQIQQTEEQRQVSFTVSGAQH